MSNFFKRTKRAWEENEFDKAHAQKITPEATLEAEKTYKWLENEDDLCKAVFSGTDAATPVKRDDNEETFEDYMRNTRNTFVNEVNSQKWNTKLRMTAEDLLICFDQMRERLSKSGTTSGTANSIENNPK